MSLIGEARLRLEIGANRLVKDSPRGLAQIKGCAVDLTIGDIFVPGALDDEVGSLAKPRRKLSLAQGSTAVIRTTETLELATSQAAVAFPASSVSLQGLLMTNPGHVDPGFVGHLHVTVINFGSEPFPLESGGRLLRALFFEQEQLALNSKGNLPSPITDELLKTLSQDFLDIEKRTITNAEKAVEMADRRTRLLGQYIPFVVAALTIAGSWFYTNSKLEERIAKIESTLPLVTQIDSLGNRVDKMEALVPALRRLDALELAMPSVEQRIRELETKARGKERR